MPKDVPRIALVDTYYDEKTETIMAAEALGTKLDGVRLDTPASRRGDFSEIIREVRWELDSRGLEKVKIYVSGGLSEETVKKYAEAGADGFGVGTAVSSAPSVDFALDIVEIDGRPVAKRGKLGSKKIVWRCEECLTTTVMPAKSNDEVDCPNGHGRMTKLQRQLIQSGQVTRSSLPEPSSIRTLVLNQLGRLSMEKKS